MARSAGGPLDRNDQNIAVGRITRAHGVHGEVAVLVLTEVEDRFGAGSMLRLEDGRALTVRDSRPHRGRLLVRFAENLIEAVNRVAATEGRKIDAMTILRRKTG